ncbi:hypothetical protein D3C77_330210 [compost metagenome]
MASAGSSPHTPSNWASSGSICTPRKRAGLALILVFEKSLNLIPAIGLLGIRPRVCARRQATTSRPKISRTNSSERVACSGHISCASRVPWRTSAKASLPIRGIRWQVIADLAVALRLVDRLRSRDIRSLYQASSSPSVAQAETAALAWASFARR